MLAVTLIKIRLKRQKSLKDKMKEFTLITRKKKGFKNQSMQQIKPFKLKINRNCRFLK